MMDEAGTIQPRRDPWLPTELLREVVSYYSQTVASRGQETSRRSYKPSWNHYQPLTLASRVLRQLTLEAWFEVYYARSPQDLSNGWPEFSVWTRELHCVELGTDLRIRPVIQWDMRAFCRLRKLRVDFDPKQSNAMLLTRFDQPPTIVSLLQELEIHDISWPSPMITCFIGQTFPKLRILKMTQDLSWCSLCNTCCFATFKDHPPEEIVYDKIVGLPRHYTTFLASLSQLETVHITISYGLGGSISVSSGNDAFWSGECDACMDMMFESTDYKKEWVKKKKTMERPPSLKSVRWRFRNKNAEDVVIDLDDNPESEERNEDDEDD
ncbi:hypothetical protein C8Q79DRAFT_659507 [Trametes meyenii]|nr:hypothetical protein C8Q79DRAFT_659507 [Trametes meyenii]